VKEVRFSVEQIVPVLRDAAAQLFASVYNRAQAIRSQVVRPRVVENRWLRREPRFATGDLPPERASTIPFETSCSSAASASASETPNTSATSRVAPLP